MDDSWTDGTRDGGKHGKQGSLHEILLRHGLGVYTLATEIV